MYVLQTVPNFLKHFYFIFFATLEGFLCDLGDYLVKWVGDMNVVVDAILDRSHPGITRTPRSAFPC